MKVYQPVAVGHLAYGDARHIIYSEIVFNTEKEAEASIEDFREALINGNNGTKYFEILPCALKKQPLRIFIKPLEVK